MPAETYGKNISGIFIAIDTEEKNFALKLSYVLSRQLGVQLYKAANQGKSISKDNGTYGNDICFPGDMRVEMADGSTRPIGEVRAGDEILTVESRHAKNDPGESEGIDGHMPVKNYAIIKTAAAGGDGKNDAGHREEFRGLP